MVWHLWSTWSWITWTFTLISPATFINDWRIAVVWGIANNLNVYMFNYDPNLSTTIKISYIETVSMTWYSSAWLLWIVWLWLNRFAIASWATGDSNLFASAWRIDTSIWTLQSSWSLWDSKIVALNWWKVSNWHSNLVVWEPVYMQDDWSLWNQSQLTTSQVNAIKKGIAIATDKVALN